MEWLQPLVLWVIAAIALIYFGLGLFNVEWRLRIRILAALTIGAFTLAAISWPMVRPADPLGPVTLFTGEISVFEAVVLISLAFTAGILAALACHPLGSTLGPFAAPAGAAVLALSGGSIRNLLLFNHSFEQQSALYTFLRLELLFWLALCTAGILAAALISRLSHTKSEICTDQKAKSSSKMANGIIGAIATAFIVYVLFGLLAQDIRQMDEQLGSVVGLAGKGQIGFGIFMSVGIAAFLVKYTLKCHYVWAILGAGAMYFFVFERLAGSSTLQNLISKWPIDYLSHPIYGVTPLQFASFAFLGGLTGFWIAVYWLRKNTAEAT